MTANGPKMRAYQLDRLGSLDGLVLERDIPSPGAGEGARPSAGEFSSTSVT